MSSAKRSSCQTRALILYESGRVHPSAIVFFKEPAYGDNLSYAGKYPFGITASAILSTGDYRTGDYRGKSDIRVRLPAGNVLFPALLKKAA